MADPIPYGKMMWTSLSITFTPFKWRDLTHMPKILTQERYRFGPIVVSWFRYPTKQEMEIKASGL